MPSAPSRRSNAERSAATRARLLDATVDSLVALGWSATTTTEVVRRAGVSRGAQVHHFPTKDDLVLAAVEHLLDRRIREFREAFADLPAEQRSPANAMRLLHGRCFGSTFDAWLELAMAARTDPALHARFVQQEARFFDVVLATFQDMFAEAAADPTFARVALLLSFSLLDGMAVHRLIDTSESDLDEVLEAFNLITAPFFPDRPGGSS